MNSFLNKNNIINERTAKVLNWLLKKQQRIIVFTNEQGKCKKKKNKIMY